MENNRPRGREKHVSGPGKMVRKRGEGLGTGPVGEAGGYKKQGQSSGTRSTRSTGSKGGIKLVILALICLLGGGGGLTTLLGGGGLGGQTGGQAPAVSAGQQSPGSVNWAQVLGGLGGGSVSSGWQGTANTGRLDTSVAPGAREKYTCLLGNGKDTVTIMLYLCGTDLESRSSMGTYDLQEMLAAKFGDSVNLLVYTGGCKAWKNTAVSSSVNQIWQIQDGQMVCLERDLGSAPMTDPDNLSWYIQWCAGRFPASRYELILWDHGGGSVSGYGYDEKFASSGSMNLAGLDSALKDAGVKFDFIGFDACLMATAETAMTMAQYADYLIASEETEPGVGWYYTDWLTALGKDPSMPTIQVGQKIVDSFVETCAQKCRGQIHHAVCGGSGGTGGHAALRPDGFLQVHGKADPGQAIPGCLQRPQRQPGVCPVQPDRPGGFGASGAEPGDEGGEGAGGCPAGGGEVQPHLLRHDQCLRLVHLFPLPEDLRRG